jgi:predicted SAM-dependent methyltransferase
MKLDIGSGPNPQTGFVGVDWKKYNKDIVVVDLNKKLPFKSNSIDEVYTSHTLEHLIDPMDMVKEIHRVLKPGAKCTIQVPYGMHPFSKKPNHKNYWNLACIDYFNGEYIEEYPKWDSVKFDHHWVQGGIYSPFEMFFDWLIARAPATYEKRFAYLFPFFELVIKLKK